MARTATSLETNRGWTNLQSQTTATLQNTEAILERIVHGCATNVVAFDETGALLCVSESWRTFAERNGFNSQSHDFGLSELRTCRERVDKSLRQMSLRDSIQRILHGRQSGFHEEFIFPTLGVPRWFLIKATKVEMPDGFRILVVLEDVTKQRQAEEELRNVGGRLINAQESERKRIARDLHDDVCQRIALLALEIDQMRSDVLTEEHYLKNKVDRLLKSTQELGRDIHRLSYDLHPFKLDHLGLIQSIECLCFELTQHNELQLKFYHHGFPAELSEEVTLCIFRIAQESLQNVVKHSGASTAQVVLTRKADSIPMLVIDNGNGFDLESAQRKKRLGLVSIRERLRPVNGKVLIRSQINKGTEIEVVIPLVLNSHAARTSTIDQNPQF
jgi:signal transduction histidine kinase